MSCSFNYSQDATVEKAIAKVAGTNRNYGLKLAELVSNPNFDAYLTRKNYAGVSKETIGVDKLSNLIEDYYKTQVLDPARTTKVKKESTAKGFVDNNVLNDCRNYFADVISAISYNASSKGDTRARDWKYLLNGFYTIVGREIERRAKEVFGEEFAAEFDRIQTNIGRNMALAEAASRLSEARHDSSTGGVNCERNGNFADLFNNMTHDDFINYCKCHTKISKIFRDYTKEDLDDAVEEYENLTDDDSVTTSNTNEEGNNTGQWNWGDNITDYKSLVSTTIKSYFDSLYLTQSTQYTVDNGKYTYDLDRDNSIGTPSTMSYQEASAELFVLGQDPDVKISPEKFLEAIRYLANSKKKFSCFIKLYNDMIDENGNINNFGRRIYSEFVKPIIDNAVLNVNQDGAIDVSQSNNDNNPTRKLYFDLYNDLKSTARSSAVIILNDSMADLTPIDTRLSVGNNELANKAFNNAVNKRIVELKYLYKSIFPSLDLNLIDAYIQKNVPTVNINSKKTTIDNLNRLLDDAKNILARLIDSNEQYDYVTSYNSSISRRNHLIDEQNKELAAQGQGNLKTKPQLDYLSTDYCSNCHPSLQPIINKLAPYASVSINLNYHDVNGHNVSGVQYNNYISNLINIFKSKDSATAKMEDIMRTNEFEYSNIFVDDPEHGIIGLFRKVNGRWQLSPYFDKVLNSYFMGGINNRNTGKSVTYATMSNSDYFYYNYMTFARGIRSYSNYNNPGQSNGGFATAPLLLTIPSDAPKNYIFEVPVYNSRELFGITKEYIDEQVNKTINDINTKTDINGYNTNVGGLMFGKSVSTEAELADTIRSLTHLAEGQKYNISNKHLVIPNGVTNLKEGFKAGQKARFVIKYISPSSNTAFRFIFEGTIKNNLGSLGIDFEGGTINYVGFYSNKTDNLDDNIVETLRTYLTKEFNKTVTPVAKIDSSNQGAMATQLRNVIKGEIQSACHYRQFFDNDGNPTLNPSQYYDNFHKQKDVFTKNGEFVGNVFHYHKLHNIIDENGNVVIDVDAELQKIAHISSTGELPFRVTHTTNGNTTVDFTTLNEAIDEFITRWVNAFYQHTVGRLYNTYAPLFNTEYNDVANHVDYMTLFDMMMNATLFDIKMDDLSHGDTAFYKDTQTYVKRSKEEQAGGILSSGANFGYQKVGNTVVNSFIPTVIDKDAPLQVDVKEGKTTKKVTLTYNKNGKQVPVNLRTAYNGVTIKNVVRPVTTANNIYKRLKDVAGVPEARAKRLAEAFGYNGGENTKIDDAQSYITFPEACRRIAQLGLWDEYKELIRQLDDPNIPAKDIDYTKFGNFIQVLKNYYYNQHFNKTFNRHTPIQIKNAEFIIIPKLVAGTQLADIHQWMLDNDIDQLNTLETSKASNANYLDIRDENDDIVDLRSQEVTDWLARPDSVVAFSYNYLYRQQAVASHLVDRTNKAGIQIMKKVLDNCDKSLKTHKDNFIDAYVTNIKESFENLYNEFGIEFDEDYNIVGGNDNIDWTRFNQRAIEECQRLGLDDNAIDSFTNTGNRNETLMPTCMSIMGNKLESVCLSIVTNAITRQTLKGAHLTQITNVGLTKRKLKYITNDDIVYGENDADLYGYNKPLRYYPDAEHPYVEVKIPKWTAALFGININDVLNDDDITKFIGYRIPTEGKQSTCIMKVVGFLPEAYDSTIAVPDGFITQTGSDFDVDSVYTIMPHIYKDKNGKIKRVPYNLNTDEESNWSRYAAYVNNNIDKSIKKLDSTSLTDDEKQAAVDKIKSLNNSLFIEAMEQVREDNTKLFETEGDIYKKLARNKTIKEKIDGILQSNDSYTNRCDRLINYLKTNKDVKQLITTDANFKKNVIYYINIYTKIRDAYKNAIDGIKGSYKDYGEQLRSEGSSKFKKVIRERAKAGELLTYEQFIKKPVIEQLTKQARENLLIDSAIHILESSTNAEETLMRSQFETLIAAKKAIDEKKGLNKVYHSPYSFEDKIYYRNNSMSGAQLKGMSVFLDSFTSIANQSHAKFDTPIEFTIKKNDNVDITELINNYDKDNVKDNGDYISIKTSNIGWSNNNRNFVGDLITVSASETTAHILDAVKEGAVENENMYTFAPFKMLLMMGLDHYTAQLWLRQPAIMEVGRAFDATNSSFIKYNANPINIAIRNIAKKFKTKSGLYATGTETPVDDSTNINTIIATLDEYFAPEGKKSTNLRKIASNIKIDGRLIDSLYNPVDETNQDAVNERVKEEILQLLMLKNIKAMANKVTQYESILSVDKYGAKSSFYETRNVFRNIYDIFNNDDDYQLLADYAGTNEGTNLLESIFPGIKSIAYKGKVEGSDNTYEARDFYEIHDGIREFLKTNSKRKSSYSIINAHMVYGCAPSYLVFHKKFETESPEFVSSITYLEEVLGTKIDANIYNQFKKYVLNDAYRRTTKMARSLEVKNDGSVDYIYDSEGRAINESVARIYGYTTGRNPVVNFEDVNNPTEEEYQRFLALSPAAKVLTLQRYINSDKSTIFSFLNSNMYHAGEVKRKGISGQSIRFDDQNNNIDYIHKLFEEAINNENKLVRATAIDLIKYSFYVEGYNYGRGKVSKTINNASLYGGDEVGGLDIIAPIVENVKSVNKLYVEDKGLVNDFIKGHSDIKGIPTYRYKYGARLPHNYENGDLNTFFFDLNNDAYAKGHASKMNVIRESFNGNVIANEYFKLSNGRTETLYKTKTKVVNNKVVSIFCYPLNKLEPYEYKLSAVDAYNRFPTEDFYEAYYEDRFNNESIVKDTAFYDKYRELKNAQLKAIHEAVTPPVEEDGVSLTYLADNVSNPNINTFIRKIESEFAANKKNTVVAIWQISPELSKTFYKRNHPYKQVITNANGETSIYNIIRKRIDVDKQVAKKNHNKIYDTLKENNIKTTEEFYTVRKVKTVFNENDIERDSSITIDDIEMDSPTNYSDLGKINKQMYEALNTDARQHKDQDAIRTLSRLESNGVDFDYVQGIEDKLETSTTILSGYFANKAARIKQKISQFCQDDDGNWVSIDDKYVLDRLMNEDEKDFREMFVETFLSASTFGEQFDEIRYLSTDNLSDTTKKNIKSIIDNINSIRTNTAIYNAVKSYIDRYIASKSLNKYIKDGMFKVSEWITTDMPMLGKMFLDTNEITDPLIQIVLKMTNVDMMEGRMAAEDNVVQFGKAWQKILNDAAASGTVINMDNVINANTNTIKEDYTDEFLKDRQKQYDNYNAAQLKYKPYDKEFIYARRKFDEWKYNNLEQRYTSDYYKEKLDNESVMLAPENIDTYCEYLKLKDKLRSLYNMEKSSYIMNEIHEANKKLRQLSSTRTVDGAKKTGTGLKTATALRNFIKREEEINKKYNEETPIHEFEELRDKYLNIIHNITYPNGSSVPISVSQREQNPAYVEAMTWLKENTVRRLPREFSEELNSAFEELRGERGRNASAMYKIIDEHPDVDFYDANGMIDGRKFSDADRNIIKQNQEYDNDATDTEIKLIRNKIDEPYVYTREFYNGLKSKNSKKDDERNDIIKQINDILSYCVGSDGKVYVSYLNIEDLTKLDKLYTQLAEHDVIYRDSEPEVAEFIRDNVTFREDVEFIKIDKQIAGEQRKKMSEDDGNKYWELYNRVTSNYQMKKLSNGGYSIQNNKKKANRYLFTYIAPKRGARSRFIDEKRTKAKNFLKENIYFTTTPYYEDARNKARAEGRFEEWFKANHVWNPYTQEMEPLRIWTTMETKSTSSYKYEYVPNYLTKERAIKEEYKNSNYKEYGANWNGKNYREQVVANEYEKKLRDLLLDTLNQFAYNDAGKRAVNKRVVPFKTTPERGVIEIFKQFGRFVGIDTSVDGNRGQSENIGYAYDRDSIVQSVEKVHIQGERKYHEVPAKLENETDEEYRKRIQDVLDYNNEVREYNEELKRKRANKDYKGLFEDFVRTATVNKYIDNSKNHLYMVLEWYRKYKEGYDVNTLGNLRINHNISTKDHTEYKRKKLTNDLELLENYIRRIYKNQFRPYSGKLDEIAALLQRMTSAKYMMLNFTGAVNNILTGRANIAMETWASEYFSTADWMAARGRYLLHIPNYIYGAFSDRSNCIEDALFKLFNIIDFDRIREGAKEVTEEKFWSLATNFAYSPQTAGEHYMQNGALLTMLMNHHVVEVNGKCHIVNKGYAKYEAEYEALKDVVENNPNIKPIYDNFIKRINQDVKLARDYQSYRRNLVEDFFSTFRALDDNKATYNNLVEEYIKYRKEFMDIFMDRFDKSKPLIDYFELVDGRAKLKEDNDLTLKDLAEFGNKVQNVNKYIHGVYDKYGAAYIESASFIGGLIMQFHKHIPNGILKYFRKNGYFNENTGLPRKGIIPSLAHILGRAYVNEINAIKNKYKDGTTDMPVQDNIKLWLDIVLRGTLNTFREFKTNYALMSELDKANLRRAIANLTWTGYMAILAIIAGCILYEDDDSLLGNWLLYSSDRSASEINSFTFGAINEIKKMSNNPMAYMSTFNDVSNVMGTAADMLISGEDYDLYYHGGQYSGENKLAVMGLRQIPIYRTIDRVRNLDRNNRYYKLGDNALSLLDINSIAEWVIEDLI